MTNAQMIQKENTTKATRLYIVFELSNGKWKLIFSDGNRRRSKTIEARDCKELEVQVEKAKEYLRQGNWAGYGVELEKLEGMLEQLSRGPQKNEP